MQVQSIDIELQMIYSAVDNIMDKLVPINCSNLAAFGTTQINLGKDILNCCVYLRKKIQNNDFDSDDYTCYSEMKLYYNAFIQGRF
jgi:hypothetical protein